MIPFIISIAHAQFLSDPNVRPSFEDITARLVNISKEVLTSQNSNPMILNFQNESPKHESIAKIRSSSEGNYSTSQTGIIVFHGGL
jgi:hypothetical protein